MAPRTKMSLKRALKERAETAAVPPGGEGPPSVPDDGFLEGETAAPSGNEEPPAVPGDGLLEGPAPSGSPSQDGLLPVPPAPVRETAPQPGSPVRHRTRVGMVFLGALEPTMAHRAVCGLPVFLDLPDGRLGLVLVSDPSCAKQSLVPRLGNEHAGAIVRTSAPTRDVRFEAARLVVAQKSLSPSSRGVALTHLGVTMAAALGR
jgi:hypothetical protein